MKLKNMFKFLGLALFFCALVLFLLAQNPNTDQLALAVLVGFGTVLGLSAASFVASELFGKITELENRLRACEEELNKLKREKDESNI